MEVASKMLIRKNAISTMYKKEDNQEHYSHIVEITCDLIATFKGKRGKVIVKNATAANLFLNLSTMPKPLAANLPWTTWSFSFFCKLHASL